MLIRLCLLSLLALIILAAKPFYDMSLPQSIVRIDFQLPHMRLLFPTEEIIKQETSVTVSFISALNSALTSLLTDNSDIESPLALIMNDKSSVSDLETAKTELMQLLNRPRTLFALLASSDEANNGALFLPEHGETTDENWIFYVTIPDLSDHLFWIIVDKNGLRPTYCYGFN